MHDARSESYCRQTTEAGLTSTTHEWADHIQFSYRRETNRTKLTRVCLGSVFLRASFDSTQSSLVKSVNTVAFCPGGGSNLAEFDRVSLSAHVKRVHSAESAIGRICLNKHKKGLWSRGCRPKFVEQRRRPPPSTTAHRTRHVHRGGQSAILQEEGQRQARYHSPTISLSIRCVTRRRRTGTNQVDCRSPHP